LRPSFPTAALLLVAALAAFAAGWWARGARTEPRSGKAFVQRREGPYKFVNPLLECDVADDVIRNQELAGFQREVARYVASRSGAGWASSVSVYFRELNDGIWFGLDEATQYTPASLRKVPMMIALLKGAEGRAGPALLDRQVVFDLPRDLDADQNVRPSQSLAPGGRYAVRELIERMIVQSDNNAFALLSRVVDLAELDRAYALLRLKDPRSTDDDRFLSVQTYASFFRILYNATYLTKEHSEWALSLLARSEFRAGLAAGVPEGVMVAHKFGEKSDAKSGEVQLHDCGVVYHPQNPYLLCVMTRGKDFRYLAEVVSGISRFVYGEVQDQLHAEP
jgi:beta-lactamase class A